MCYKNVRDCIERGVIMLCNTCYGCAIINNIRCCYNCAHITIRNSEAHCTNYSGKVSTIFKDNICLGFESNNHTYILGEEIEINYCPVCGRKL